MEAAASSESAAAPNADPVLTGRVGSGPGLPSAGSTRSEIEIEPGVAAEIFGSRIDLARRYVEALATDGVIRGLIGPREAGRLWTRHVLNSAVVGEVLSAGTQIVDIGSGAGLPGIPLAIARMDCSFILVEPLERRVIFLEAMIADLGLSNCRVIRGRADQVTGDCGNADVVTSRAVAPLATLALWSAPLLRVGGELRALKGSSAGEEIERDRAAAEMFGLRDFEVISVGVGLVDPPTLVVTARKVPSPTRGARKAQPSRGRSVRRDV